MSFFSETKKACSRGRGGATHVHSVLIVDVYCIQLLGQLFFKVITTITLVLLHYHYHYTLLEM